jgi:hypothetical protein
MRILGKFKDYYDSAMAHGVDRSVVYARETREIDFDRNRQPFLAPCAYHASGLRHDCVLSPFLLIIAGKVHPGLRCDRRTGHMGFDRETRHLYSLDQAKALLTDWDLAHLLPEEDEGRRRWNPYRSRTLDDVFAPVAPEVAKAICDWAIRDKVTLALVGHPPKGNISQEFKLILDPCLKDLEFYRVMDAFATFQELSAWVGGVLANNPDPAPVSDQVRIQQHGFDEWSFRKQPAVGK